MKNIYKLSPCILLLILSITTYGQQYDFGYSGKIRFTADPALRLYSSLKKPEVAAKLYSYEQCFKLKGDTITAVDPTAVETYLKNIRETNLFSDQYIAKEKKWIASINKELTEKGFYKKDFTDKYYGSNPEGVKQDIAQWDVVYKKGGSHPAVLFSSSRRGYSGNLRTIFPTAGYEMKYGIRGQEGSDDVWKIDSIKQIEKD